MHRTLHRTLPGTVLDPATTAAAAPPWSPPIALAGAGARGDTAVVRVDGRGVTHVAWLAQCAGTSAVRLRRIDADGTPAPAVGVVAPTTSTLAGVGLAVTDDGVATVLHQRAGGGVHPACTVRARQVGPHGTMGAELLVAGTTEALLPNEDAQLPQAGVDAGGRVTVVFERRMGAAGPARPCARRIDPDGGLGPIVELDGESAGGRQVVVVVEPAGGAVALWKAHTADLVSVRARGIRADGAPDPLVHDLGSASAQSLLLAAGHPAWGVTVAFERRGAFVLRRIGVDGRLDPRTWTLSEGHANGLDLATSASGDSVATWLTSGDGRVRAMARRLSAAGVLSAPVEVAVADVSMRPAQVRLDGVGRALIVWARNRVEDVFTWTTRARWLMAGGTLSPVVELGPTPTLAASAPRLGLDPVGGRATAVWSARDGALLAASVRGRFEGDLDGHSGRSAGC